MAGCSTLAAKIASMQMVRARRVPIPQTAQAMIRTIAGRVNRRYRLANMVFAVNRDTTKNSVGATSSHAASKQATGLGMRTGLHFSLRIGTRSSARAAPNASANRSVGGKTSWNHC